MLHIALYQPEIPPNTGNIIRLCANTGCQLHLIHPLGFKLDEKKLRRAGLDYQEWACVQEHHDYQAFASAMHQHRIIGCTTKSTQLYNQLQYQDEDVLLFGPETRGLPQTILNELPNQVRIPMQTTSRSINLSNAVSIISYEALRQIGFEHFALQ